MTAFSDTFSAKYRTYVDNGLIPEVLEGFQPSELSLKILNCICDQVGSDRALIVGGDLTAEYARQNGHDNAESADVDIHLHLHDAEAAANAYDDFAAIRAIADAIDDAPGFKRTSGVKITNIGKTRHTKLPYGNVSFEFEGRKVDVAITQDPISLQSRALYGDAIIKSVAADRTGQVMAHPYFEEDMQNGEYTIRVTQFNKAGHETHDHERSVERYAERSAYLADFELVESSAYSADLNAA